MYCSKRLSKYKSISHCFLNNQGGKSKGIYKSLNCGKGSNDKEENVENKKDNSENDKVWNTIIEKDLSVRAAESIIKKTGQVQKKKKVSTRAKSAHISALENELIEILGTKVRLRPSKVGGSIEVSYFSDDDLERIIDLLNKIILIRI